MNFRATAPAYARISTLQSCCLSHINAELMMFIRYGKLMDCSETDIKTTVF